MFSCASRVGGGARFRVRTIGAGPGLAPLRPRAGLSVRPEADFAGSGKIDVLIVPGGVITADLSKPEVVAWIAGMARDCELVASVRTGAFLLAQAGLLAGQDVATHWNDLPDLRAAYSALTKRGDRRRIDSGGIVTSGGISAGIDMSLHLVKRLAGRDLALRTSRQMEYDWNEARR